MIGKVVTGKSFGHCIAYCLDDKILLTEEMKLELSIQDGLQHRNRAEVLEYNYCYGDKYELAAQFQDVANLSRRVEKPVLHLTIRLAPGDQLTRAQWIEIGQEAAKEFGIDKNQYISVLHKDTAQPHIHIVANRVGYDGRVASDSNSYARMAAFCRRMEKKYGLKQVLSPRRFLSEKEKQIPRQDLRKLRLKEKIAEALKGARDFAEFERRMKAQGYRIDKGRGIAFEDDKKVRIKGSEVGYSLATIQRILTQSQKPQPEARQVPKPEITAPNEKDTKPSLEPGQSFSPVLTGLLNQLLKSESAGGSGPDPAEEEERRRKRKKKRLGH